MGTSVTSCCRTGVTTKVVATGRVPYRGSYTLTGDHIDYVDDSRTTLVPGDRPKSERLQRRRITSCFDLKGLVCSLLFPAMGAEKWPR